MALGLFDKSAKLATKSPVVESLWQFEGDTVPPILPSDSWFFLEPTSFSVSGVSSNLLGNRLLDLLQTDASANVTKVNQNKFSIKARVSIGGRDCDVKVRIFQQESGYKIEFQRRSGDAVVFHDVYRLAEEQLCPQETCNLGERSC